MQHSHILCRYPKLGHKRNYKNKENGYSSSLFNIGYTAPTEMFRYRDWMSIVVWDHGEKEFTIKVPRKRLFAFDGECYEYNYKCSIVSFYNDFRKNKVRFFNENLSRKKYKLKLFKFTGIFELFKIYMKKCMSTLFFFKKQNFIISLCLDQKLLHGL